MTRFIALSLLIAVTVGCKHEPAAETHVSDTFVPTASNDRYWVLTDAGDYVASGGDWAACVANLALRYSGRALRRGYHLASDVSWRYGLTGTKYWMTLKADDGTGPDLDFTIRASWDADAQACRYLDNGADALYATDPSGEKVIWVAQNAHWESGLFQTGHAGVSHQEPAWLEMATWAVAR